MTRVIAERVVFKGGIGEEDKVVYGVLVENCPACTVLPEGGFFSKDERVITEPAAAFCIWYNNEICPNFGAKVTGPRPKTITHECSFTE